MSALTSSHEHSRIFIFTHPRTASNLFMRLFESHPDLSVTKYIFNDTFYCGSKSLLCRHSSQRIFQRDGLSQNATYQSCFDKLQNFIADAEAAGKVLFIKEHLFYITDPQVVVANVMFSQRPRPMAKGLPISSVHDHTFFHW